MDENVFPAAERIINDIGLIFKKDPKLKEFQILPVTLNENRSPVHHENNCLGLESWCVPHVYCYAYNLLMDIRQHKRRREDAEYVNHLLMGVLLLNPEVSVMWNMRREISGLNPQSELHFTSVVLTRKPKCAQVFEYRKWLIKELMNVYPCDPILVASEVDACQLAAELYPNNYYAWNHRIWCLDLLPHDSGSYVSFLVSEWMLTYKWVATHVSDHSGFQYRQHLLQKFVNLPPDGFSTVGKCTTDIEKSATSSLQMFLTSVENKKCNYLTETTKNILSESSCSKCEKVESIPLGLILSELLFNTDLIVVYPGHEAIWYHRRFLIHLLLECISNLMLDAEEHKVNNGVSPEKTKRVESVEEGLLGRVVRFETVLYSRCRADKDRQASLAEKHRAWLAAIMKINLHLPLR